MGECREPTVASSALITGYRTGVDVRMPGADPPVCINGKGLGRALGVWLSVDIFLGRDGESFLVALALELSCIARFAGVEFNRLPFTTLLGVESTMISLISGFRPDCTSLDASPVAGVGAMEELGPDCGSAMVDADPRGSVRSTSRLCPAGVNAGVADICRCIRCW